MTRMCVSTVGGAARPNNTAFAVKIKLEQKDLSPPLFIEEVSRSDGGVFKVVPMGIGRTEEIEITDNL